jgi:hypothetical protein
MQTVDVAAETPSWTDIVVAVGTAVAGLGVVVGGLFAYFRFVRGRVIHSRCEPRVAPSLVDVHGSPAMLVQVTIANAGTMRLVFSGDCPAMLTVTAATRAMWADALEHGEVLWSEGVAREQDLFVVEKVRDVAEELEPGEQLRRSVLVPLPPGSWWAYRVSLQVDARPQGLFRTLDPFTWKTESLLITGGLDDG